MVLSSGGSIVRACYRSLPAAAQELVARAFVAGKRRRLRSLRTPTTLVFFITSRCNARCAHCFYWQELNRGEDELTLEEIRRVGHSLRHPVHLSLTGGEPFLRDDVFEICKAFRQVNGCRDIGLATNGILTNRIVSTTARVACELGLRSLAVQISVDGLAETHDAIRGIRGGYRRALETVAELRRLATRDPRFSVSVSITVQQANLGEVPRVVEELLPLRVPIRFALVRGQGSGTYGLGQEAANEINPKEEAAPVVDLEALEGLFATLERMNAVADYRFWSERQQRKVRLSLAMMRQRARQLPCYAGSIDGVLYANGDVALCELTKVIGNVRDAGYDLESVWRSAGAQRMRALIRGCFCIHGCNLATSLMFDPAVVRDVVAGRGE